MLTLQSQTDSQARGHAPVWLWWATSAVVVATLVGAAFAPVLAVHYPWWLLWLNPWPRHQLLVAPRTEILPFVAVVATRGFLTCLVSYELGRNYGPQGVSMLSGRSSRAAGVLALMSEQFGRYSRLLLLLVPGWMTSALAGTSGLPRASAMLPTALGLSLWASINYRVGHWLEPWISALLALVRQYMLSASIACIASVAIYQLLSRRGQGRAAGLPVDVERETEVDVDIDV